MRPTSIIMFERLYLGAWAVGLLNTVVNWNTSFGRMQTNPDMAMPTVMLLVSLCIGFVIPLLLWFFIARKRSAVAKWILVVLFALGLMGLAFAATRGTLFSGSAGMLSLIAAAMQAGAVMYLFRPDAAAWFGETRGNPGDGA